MAHLKTIKMKKIVALLSLSTLLCLCSCDPLKPLPGCEGSVTGGQGNSYKFEIPFIISPVKDTFIIGDTITIESSFGDSLLNHYNNKYYQIGDFDFFTFIYINDLRTNPIIGTTKFEIIPVIGRTKEDPSSFGKQFFMKHDYKDFKHRYMVKIVMQDSGYFVFSPASFIVEHTLNELGQQITDCERESVSLNYKTNNGNGNFSFRNFALDQNVREWKEENMKLSGLFFFYVKNQ